MWVECIEQSSECGMGRRAQMRPGSKSSNTGRERGNLMQLESGCLLSSEAEASCDGKTGHMGCYTLAGKFL